MSRIGKKPIEGPSGVIVSVDPGRVTVMVPSSCVISIRVGTCWRSSPFGPDTVTRPGSIATITPAGTSIGFLPIRLTVHQT